MCTVIFYYRPGHEWPLLFAGNRDEMRDRAWSPPARHWPERGDVVAGLDQSAGGSWLGLNDHGVLAAVMNREGSLGPSPGKRSRGELVLEALDHGDASSAAGALADLNSNSYRPFNLIVADPTKVCWVCLQEGRGIELIPVDPGLHMISSTGLDDYSHPRIAAYLDRFHSAPVPDPESGDWVAWQALMSETEHPSNLGPLAAMNILDVDGFGTVSSSLIALPRYPGFVNRPRWMHAAGSPHEVSYRPVDLEA